jgi:hypothetical protein
MSSVPQTCPFTGTAPFDDDVWFFFNATETSHQIDITNITGSSDDLIYEIFSGSCGSLTTIRCHDDPDTEIILKDLVVSNSYYIRVASFPTTGQTTTFSICVKSAPTPPANDECTSAIALTIVDTSCNATAATLVGATPSSQAENCEIQTFFNDIWFSFTANQPKQIIEFSNIVERPVDLFGQISSGTCGGITEVDCFSIPFAQNNTTYTATGLQSGTSYFLRIASYDVDPLSTTFDICIRDTIPDPPVNDECASSLPITVSPGIICTSSVSSTVAGATPSGVASSCPSGGNFDDDVWFSFTATSATHEIILTNVSGPTQDLDVQVNSGSCGALSQLICHRDLSPSDSTGFEVTGLVPGNTYYIRVASFPAGLQSTTFDICVRTPVPPCTLIVTSTSSSGPGSLRSAIECSEPGDTIRFDASLVDQTVSLDTPKIVVKHHLVLEAEFSDNIMLSNSDVNLSDILICIQANLIINGLTVAGLSAESMVWKIEAGGSLELFDSEIEQTTVDR